jgi:hypothetical protein
LLACRPIPIDGSVGDNTNCNAEDHPSWLVVIGDQLCVWFGAGVKVVAEVIAEVGFGFETSNWTLEPHGKSRWLGLGKATYPRTVGFVFRIT